MRLLVATVCAAALVVGGATLERLGPRPVSAGRSEEPVSGAWSCPHGGGEGWRVWVTLANPGPEPIEVRMTTSAGGAAPPASTSVLEPSTLRYVEVNAPIPGSATVVEFLGGTVAAGSVVMAPDGGIAAEPCASSPGASWHVTEASTLRGETAYLVVHNPFAAQAVVDVILTTADERATRPGRLQGVVLGPLDARAFELNHFELGEKALAAEVVAPQGRVAVASVVVSPGGVRSSLAVPGPATQWFFPGAGAETEFVVRALPDQDAPIGAEFQTEQGPVPALDLEVVSAGTAQSFGFVLPDAGLVVRSDGLPEMVAGRRMFLEERAPDAPQEEPTGEAGDRKGQGGKGSGQDQAADKPADGKREGKGGAKKKEEPPPEPPAADLAATRGSSHASDRWLVMPAVSPAGGPSILLLQNPGDEEVTATVTLLGTAGAQGMPASVTIPAHATARFPLPADAPVAALVEGGPLVPGQATLAPGAFAVTLGLEI